MGRRCPAKLPFFHKQSALSRGLSVFIRVRLMLLTSAALAFFYAVAGHADDIRSPAVGDAMRRGIASEAVSRQPPVRGSDVALAYSGLDRSRRVALVIGNSRYLQLPALSNPKNDAEDVCNSLRSVKFETVCLYDISSAQAFRAAIELFISKLDVQSTAFFYYAGHGVQLNGENYFIPTSADGRSASEIEDDGLSLGFLLKSLEKVRSAPNIVVLDACRQSPFSKASAVGAIKGLARVDPPVGTLLVYATGPNGIALDGEGRNGLFTKHLLAHLAEPGQKIDELFRVVAKEVQDEAKIAYRTDQVPYRSSSYSDDFCLAGCDSPKVTEELDRIKRLQADAASRISALVAENADLKRQSDEHSSKVTELEARIRVLNGKAAEGSGRDTQAQVELTQLKAELDAMRRDETKVFRYKSEVNARDDEIALLKSQILDLQSKAKQLEDYGREISLLKKENAQRARMMSTDQPASPPNSTSLFVPAF